jgi:hypothetical protein
MRIRTLLALAACTALISPAPAQESPPRISQIRLDESLDGRRAAIVLVKDFFRLENTGGLVRSAEFQRYSPVIDDEQLVLGRWVDAHTAGGTSLPIDIASITPDPSGNLIQTLRIRPLPPGQIVTVTITSLVARRERPAPTGPFPILSPEHYPDDVRPFLAATPMVVVDHPIVRKTADTILSQTTDAREIAVEIARLAKDRPYIPPQGADTALPTSASVLKNGGSCCGSAVAAAAVFRACGIPAQVTYCPPPSYVHGIVRFYLKDYGWVRMDATSGTGNFPLVQQEQDLTLIRLFDMPIKMEQIEHAYAWPYQHNDIDGAYRFLAAGEPCPQVRMYHDNSGQLPFVQKPFPHLEPGSWSALLGSEPLEEEWADFNALVAASRAAALTTAIGPFQDLSKRLPTAKPYLDTAATWSRPSTPTREPPGRASP